MVQFKKEDCVITSRKRIGVIVVPPEYLVETDECAISTFDVNDLREIKNQNIKYRITQPSVRFGNNDILQISANQLHKIQSLNVKTDFAKVIDFVPKTK